MARRLVDGGYQVRALARKGSKTDALKELGVEIALGDLGDESSVAAAIDGVDIVVHAAAGTSGTARDSETATIQGTRSVLKACKATAVNKLVYISSCNVYEVAGCAENDVVTEEAQLERFAFRRGHYTAAKLEAERLVTAAINEGGCPIVVLRPGTLYGSGGEVYTKMIGISFARRIFIVFGDGSGELPLVHVENAVDAIVECITNKAADNQVFNVVDHEVITKKTYIERVVKTLYPGAKVFYCPMSLLIAFTAIQEKIATILGTRPFLTVYRLLSSQRQIRYSTSKICRATGWRPRARFAQFAEQLPEEVRAQTA